MWRRVSVRDRKRGAGRGRKREAGEEGREGRQQREKRAEEGGRQEIGEGGDGGPAITDLHGVARRELDVVVPGAEVGRDGEVVDVVVLVVVLLKVVRVAGLRRGRGARGRGEGKKRSDPTRNLRT